MLILSGCKQTPKHLDVNLPLEARVNHLLNELSLDEKVTMLSGINDFYTQPIPRLEIPSLFMSDGPLGTKEGGATAFPAGPCMASTWNPELIEKVGNAIANECVQNNIDLTLGPTVNIHRIPGGGRNFESFSEDPVLASAMARHYVRGVQSRPVGAVVKHFVCNNHEYNRLAVDVVVSDRALNEIYFPAFKAAIDEGCLAVMGAYNRVNGDFACSSYNLLTETLKESWGFEGLAMSDWLAVHSSAKTINAGLDIEMPGGTYLVADTLLRLLDEKKISEARIDDAVKRLLTVMFKLGYFDGEVRVKDTVITPIDKTEHRKVALDVAREGTVLLKNENHILPLDTNKNINIVLIGPNANKARTGGGGSSFVEPEKSVSLYEALSHQLGAKPNITLNFAQGVVSDDNGTLVPSTCLKSYFEGKEVNGLQGEYFANVDLSGTPVFAKTDTSINHVWNAQSSPVSDTEVDSFSIRWTGYLVPEKSGFYRFSASSDDGTRVYINNKQVIDNWSIQGMRTKSCEIPLQEGKYYDIKIEYFENTGFAAVNFKWEYLSETNLMAEAVSKAKKADVAIVCVGFSKALESEGWDLADLQMSYKQNGLIQAVAAVNKNTIVILNGGVVIDVSSWIHSVSGLIEAWYPGGEGNIALAEIITGKISPSGKLPVTFIRKWSDCYAYAEYPEVDGKAVYKEDVFVGYRYYDTYKIEPQFCFGHGLTYTQFELSSLQAPQWVKKDSVIRFSLQVANTGNYAASEVVQVYVGENTPTVVRPVKELKSFKKVYLKPGESTAVLFEIDDKDLAFYSEKTKGWVTNPGVYTFYIGCSVDDIRIKTEFLYRNNEFIDALE